MYNLSRTQRSSTEAPEFAESPSDYLRYIILVRTKMDIPQIRRQFKTEHLLLLGLIGSSLFFRRLHYVYGAPVPDSSGATVPQAPAAQPPSTSTFQVLAAGTQDLAALVGLFATDSVERYAIDYSRGYLSVAVAHCSVLGILGYVRAMVKIAMGAAACEKAAFPTGTDQKHCFYHFSLKDIVGC